MTLGKEKKLFSRLLEGMTVEDALGEIGVTGEQLYVARRRDPEFAAEMEAIQGAVAENKLYGLAMKGNPGLLRAWLNNRLPARWKPDISLGLTSKDDLARRAGGRPGSINIRRIIVNVPQELSPRRPEVIDIAPRALESPAPTPDDNAPGTL